jgi:branched-subunit amino acid transport protein
MSDAGIWLTLLGAGVVTFIIRLSFIALLGNAQVPDAVRRALRFVPPAVLSAIIFPEVLQPGGHFDLSLTNARLWAGVLAALVAWRTKNILLTIAVGMAVMWLVQFIIGR